MEARSVLRTIAACVTVVFLLVGCRQGQGPASQPTPVGSVAGPGANRSALRLLPLSVPRKEDLSHADPAHFAAALGNDPQRIFAFVRDSISYEAYRGLLRGPRGTLLAGAGNAVDRSALLAAMLERAGQRVRFARGTLDERRARDLVMSMWAARQEIPGSPPAVPPKVKAATELFRAAARRDFALIRERMDALGVQLRPDSIPTIESLVQDAQQHYWVQWSREGTWVDLDPLFPDAQPGDTHAKAEQNFFTLPPALAHQVHVRVTVEEYTGSVAARRRILTFSRPAADLSGMDLVLMQMPENWQGPAATPDAAIAAAVANTGRLIPVLLAGGEHFKGDPFQPAMPARGIGSIGRLLGGGGETLATAEFLEVEFVDPSGGMETVTREIFDALGPARRAAGRTLTTDEIQKLDIADLQKSIYSLYFTTGRIDPGHVVGVSSVPPSPGGDEPVEVRTFANRIHILFASLSDALAGRGGEPDRANVLFYPDSPRLTILDFSQRGDLLWMRLDLRRDRVRAVASGPHPEEAVIARIQRGVIDGTLERMLMLLAVPSPSEPPRRADAVFGTSALFDEAQAAGLEFLAVPRERTRVSADVPQDALTRLDADVSRGYVAVVPRSAPLIEGTPRYAWWRIHPATGETTAVTDEGLYGAATEQPAVTAVVTRSPLGVTEAVRVYYMGVFGRVLIQAWVGAEAIAQAGGIAAILQLLRGQGIPTIFR
jgi:hypothetical protein